MAADGALIGLGGFEKPVWALAAQQPRQELSGTQFELIIGEIPVNYTGKIGVATVVNGQLPAPLLRWRERDTVTIKVTNQLKVPSSIHWHGIILPRMRMSRLEATRVLLGSVHVRKGACL